MLLEEYRNKCWNTDDITVWITIPKPAVLSQFKSKRKVYIFENDELIFIYIFQKIGKVLWFHHLFLPLNSKCCKIKTDVEVHSVAEWRTSLFKYVCIKTFESKILQLQISTFFWDFCIKICESKNLHVITNILFVLLRHNWFYCCSELHIHI